MKPNTYIGITILAGFILIGFLYSQGGATQIPGVIVAIGVLCKLFQTDAKVELTTAKVAEVKADQAITNKQVSRSIDVSTANANAIAAVAVQQGHAIEQVSQKVDENTATTETTHVAVNSRMDEFRKALEDVAAMKQEQSLVLAELTAAKAELAIANERARGIAEGRAQVTQQTSE